MFAPNCCDVGGIILKAYVEVRDGYIDSWSTIANNQYNEIDVTEELFGLIGCVKVENGIAVLDEEKHNQQIEDLSGPSELEILQEENKALKQELEETKADVTNTQIGLAEVYGIVMGGNA